MTEIGIQLYGFGRQRIDNDLAQILDCITAQGYQCIEGFPGHYEVYAGQVRSLGLKYNGPHVLLSELEERRQLVDYCQAMGAGHVINSGLLEWNERSRDDYLRSIERLNAHAVFLQGEGIQLHYHNHEFEFNEAVDGANCGMELLLEESDPTLHFCFDLGWIARAGVNPAAFLAAHGDRCSCLHLRDFKDGESVVLGQGDLDLSAVLQEVQQLTALEALMVEQDPGGNDPFIDAAQSLQWLNDHLH